MKFKPKDLATIKLSSSSRCRLVEVISNPIPAKRFIKPETIMVRMVPGEETTMVEVAVSDLEVPKLSCVQRYCHIAEVDCKGFPLNEAMLPYDNAALYDHQALEWDCGRDEPGPTHHRFSKIPSARRTSSRKSVSSVAA